MTMVDRPRKQVQMHEVAKHVATKVQESSCNVWKQIFLQQGILHKV